MFCVRYKNSHLWGRPCLGHRYHLRRQVGGGEGDPSVARPRTQRGKGQVTPHCSKVKTERMVRTASKAQCCRREAPLRPTHPGCSVGKTLRMAPPHPHPSSSTLPSLRFRASAAVAKVLASGSVAASATTNVSENSSHRCRISSVDGAAAIVVWQCQAGRRECLRMCGWARTRVLASSRRVLCCVVLLEVVVGRGGGVCCDSVTACLADTSENGTVLRLECAVPPTRASSQPQIICG